MFRPRDGRRPSRRAVVSHRRRRPYSRADPTASFVAVQIPRAQWGTSRRLREDTLPCSRSSGRRHAGVGGATIRCDTGDAIRMASVVARPRLMSGRGELSERRPLASLRATGIATSCARAVPQRQARCLRGGYSPCRGSTNQTRRMRQSLWDSTTRRPTTPLPRRARRLLDQREECTRPPWLAMAITVAERRAEISLRCHRRRRASGPERRKPWLQQVPGRAGTHRDCRKIIRPASSVDGGGPPAAPFPGRQRVGAGGEPEPRRPTGAVQQDTTPRPHHHRRPGTANGVCRCAMPERH